MAGQALNEGLDAAAEYLVEIPEPDITGTDEDEEDSPENLQPTGPAISINYSEAEYAGDTVLVTPAEGSNQADVASALGVTEGDITDIGAGFYEVKLPQGTSVQDAMATLEDSGAIEATQPDFIYYLQDELDDQDNETPDGEAENDNQDREGESTGDADPTEGGSPADDFPADEEATENPDEDSDDNQDGTNDEQLDDDTTLADPAEGDSPEDKSKFHTDDARLADQWALESINAFEAWDTLAQANAQRVTVAVIDEGFDVTHEDLQGNLIADADGAVLGYNAVDQSGDVSEVAAGTSSYAHGTHVAGIVGARVNNAIGVAGISFNQAILPVKVFKDDGTASTSTLAKAYGYILEHAGEYSVRVVNLSVGVTGKARAMDEALKKCIDQAYAAGIVTVASAGNASSKVPVPADNYPSDDEHVVAVMNLKQDESSPDGVSRSVNSNYNVGEEQAKNISAPGTGILSTYPNSAYSHLSGTSMAAPCVSGVLAMEFAVNPDLSAPQAIEILYKTARDLGVEDGNEGFDAQTGWGEVDAAAAVEQAMQTEGAGPVVDIGGGEDPFDTGENENGGENGKDALYLDDAEVSPIPAQYFSGAEITPKPQVKLQGKVLSEGDDYMFSYEGNKNVGQATVTVTGMGAYVGSLSLPFQIIAKPIYTLGATRMPASSTARWVLKGCTLKVVSGQDVVSIAKDGRTVKAVKKGNATIAVVDAAGKQVATRDVEVYKLKGSYQLQSAKKTSLYLGVKGSSKANGAQVQAVSAKKAPKVKFVLKNGYYQVKLVDSKKYLNVKNASKKNKALVVQDKKSNAKSQQWKITVDKKNRLTFVNRNSGKVLTLKGSLKPGAKAIQRTPTGALREKWLLVQ